MNNDHHESATSTVLTLLGSACALVALFTLCSVAPDVLQAAIR